MPNLDPTSTLRFICFINGNRARKLTTILETVENSELRMHPVFPTQSAFSRLQTCLHALRDVLLLRNSVTISDGTGLYSLVLLAATRLRSTTAFAVRLRGDVWRESRLLQADSELSSFGRLRAFHNLSLSKIVVRYADFVFPVSESLGDIAVSEVNVDPDKVTVIPLAVDANRFRPLPSTKEIDEQRRKLGVVGGEHIVFSLTNFDYFDKVLPLAKFIQVFDELNGKDAGSLSWVIGGSGQFLDTFTQQFMNQSDFVDRIRFLGQISNPEEWFQVCDLFVHYTGYDALPNVLLEAMASGTAVVANNYPGFSSIIQSGENGYLVDPDSPEMVEEIVTKLLCQSVLADRIGSAARQEALDHYSPEALGNVVTTRIFGPFGPAQP